MKTNKNSKRQAPINLSLEEFRQIGYTIIDQIADLIATLPENKVTTGEPPSKIKTLFKDKSVPENGMSAEQLVNDTLKMLFEHSLFTGHPKYWGYITSSSSPIGALSELIAATLNPNVAAWALSPVASEMEKQTTGWIAEMIGYPKDCGGILVSGGNMANFHCYLTARQANGGESLVQKGVNLESTKKMIVYASTETHLWLHKAAALFGNGTDSIRWIEVDSNLKMKTASLKKQIQQDIADGFKPIMVVGTGGTVGTGTVDPLPEIYKICQEFNLWFHVDGAYGAFAAMLPDAPEELYALQFADSIALDPHKWLYAPIEAGCVLVKDKNKLKDTFSYHPTYYKFDQVAGEEVESFFDFGMQNSRGFRALKVWMGIKQVGKSGYQQMIAEDIELARILYNLADQHERLEAISTNLSITTFRYIPKNLPLQEVETEEYLNKLNMELLTQLQESGEAFVSNAIIQSKYVLRACFVNFRSSQKDVEELVEIVLRFGERIESSLL